MFDDSKERRHYRGVLCSRCGTSIPISSKASALRDEFRSAAHNATPFSFTLRCKVCCEETVYTVSDVQEFEGEPKRQARHAPPRLRLRGAHG
jgi:hypothetical protein